MSARAAIVCFHVYVYSTLARCAPPTLWRVLHHGRARNAVAVRTGSGLGAQSAVVRATNSVGTFGQTIVLNVRSSIYSDTTPPTPPTNVVISNLTSTSVDISWTAGTDDVGVVRYQLYNRTVTHSPKGSGSTVRYSAIGYISGTSAHFSGLKPNTVYS